MKIESHDLTILKMFDQHKVFQIPAYQRNYAWGEEEINDFFDDLRKCYDLRVSGNPKVHFLGGIVSVEKKVLEAHRHAYDIVDGQQRLTTLVLLVTLMLKHYEKLLDCAKKENDLKNSNFCKNQIEKINRTYISYEATKNREPIEISRLKLSSFNNDFFIDLLKHKDPEPEDIDSRLKLKTAYKKLYNFIDEMISQATNLDNKISVLEKLENILSEDFIVLHIITESKEDAYTLFQVLNDRGINLTDGDLTKASTLEFLDNFNSDQKKVEKYWNDILSEHPTKIDSNLRWIYASYKGKRAGKFTLNEELLKEFYSGIDKRSMNSAGAEKVVDITKKLLDDVNLCRDILNSNWPFKDIPKICLWKKNRLNIVIDVLNNKACMPLLLSASSHLDPSSFYEIVDIVERFFFRYKIICNGHASPIVKIYNEESKKIRSENKEYDINELREKFRELLKQAASDTNFSNLLPERIEYKSNGRSNIPLRYFLTTIDHYIDWFNKGAEGKPEPSNLTHIYDLKRCTIEHIYPLNASSSFKNTELDKLANTIGNLSFFDQNDNNEAGNENFNFKKPIFEKSMVKMNQEIAKEDNWNEEIIKNRQARLIEIALKVFSV